MTSKFVQKAQQLGMNPTECNWFQFFAQETWDRIGFARTRKGLRIFETTVTQNLIFEFQSSREMYLNSPMLRRTWGIDIKESVNESTNGNDIELFIDIGGDIYFFAVQAKIINHNGFKRAGMVDGNYLYISHKVGNVDQIDLLTTYARNRGGIPLYLLYNFVKQTFQEKRLCNVEYEIEQYGCSIVSADYIKNNFRNAGAWTLPMFSDLHPKTALPWFVLACCFTQNNINEVLSSLQLISPPESFTKYTLDSLQGDRNWRTVAPFNEIVDSRGVSSGLEDEDLSIVDDISQIKSVEQIEFKPRYRIVISPELAYDVKKSSFSR